jgi:type IV pilus assembly protein PilQ
MNTKQNNDYCEIPSLIKFGWLVMALIVLLQTNGVLANEKAIESVQFSTNAGNKVQLQLEMNSQVIEPKVFQTDNPARIALDFAGVKSHLAKRSFPINQGAVNTVYVLEVGNRTRVILNLVESVTYKTRIDGNKFYVVLDAGKSNAVTQKDITKRMRQSNVSRLLPQQTIKSIDFRRGKHGEGRLLLALSNPNTVVDIKERGGKIVLNFLNTKLPGSLAKRYDVVDFATPVETVDVSDRGNGAMITITTVDGNYEYSSFQAEGGLTVEFRPITVEEKAALLKEKFPFVGDKLSLNFQDIEVRSVLQILADFTELNIIASDSVGGSVTLRLNDVPWDQALALVLKSKGLAKRESGNVVYVAPVADITKMEEEELVARKIVQRLEPLKTEYVQINYGNAEDYREMLMSSSRGVQDSSDSGGTNGLSDGNGNGDELRILSQRGNIIVDSRTNMLIVRDTAKQLAEIRKLIKLLDIPVRQVLIESRIVVADVGFTQELGVKFGVAERADAGGGKEFGLTGTGVESSTSSDILADLGDALAASSGGTLALTLVRTANYILNLEISALQNDRKGELLSNPRVMTQDRVQAFIRQGVQIPYQSGSQNGTVTELVDAVLELNVTPQITPNGSVIMELDIKKDNPGTPLATGNIAPTVPIDTRHVTTTVQVEDGGTVVLGGIFESENASTEDTVPWFADLPGIGWMFKQTITTETKRELLVFVTPKIVKDTFSVN